MRLAPRLVIVTFIFMSLLLFAPCLFTQDEGLVAKWSFDEAPGRITRDGVNGTEDKVVAGRTS